MNNKDKHYLKTLLLASISSIGMPAAQAADMSTYVTRRENEGGEANIEMVSETLTNGILESNPSFGEIMGHSSHSSHGSHGSHSSSSHGSHSSHTSSSHTSHTSHTSSSHTSHTSSSHTSHTSSSHSSHASSSGYTNGGYNSLPSGSTHSGKGVEVRGLLIGTGTVLAAVGVYVLVKYIIKCHKNHVAARKADINKMRTLASRDLRGGMYGYDVDSMTELLIDNDALDKSDRKFSPKWSHYKYNRMVKRSVKRMQARMGQHKSGRASIAFQMNLQQWKNRRKEIINATENVSLDITKHRNALLAVAILLVEKGYLNCYNADDIMNENEKTKIIQSYYTFLNRHQLEETTLVDSEKLVLLNSLPNKQK